MNTNDLETWQMIEEEIKTHRQWIFIFCNPKTGKQGVISRISPEGVADILGATVKTLESGEFDRTDV